MRTELRRLFAASRDVTVVVALGLALLAAGAHAGPKDDASGAAPSEIKVGIAPMVPPFAFREGDKLTGLETDFAHKLEQELSAKVQLVELPWKELIPALRDKRIDVIMSGMSITKERQAKVDFTSPYLRVGQMALIRKADINRLGGAAAMRAAGVRIGFLDGTTGEQFARKELPKAKHVGVTTIEDGVAALRGDKIDFLVLDAPSVWRIRGQLRDQYDDLMGRFRPLTEEYLAWAVRKDEGALRQRLNSLLSSWEDNGTLESALDTWIPVRKVTLDAKN